MRLLLRPLASLEGAAAQPALARLLGRADRQQEAPGWRPQLGRAFSLLPAGLPVAALTRSIDAADAAHGQWLRADPAWLQPDATTVRMMACGELGLSAAEADALLKPLKPLFGDAGFPIDAPVPQRWYLALPREARLPAFVDPHDALGAPLDQHLPEGEAGRRWRLLSSEAQVVLHNHPLNRQRIDAGKPPVNSLWFWGAGPLPDAVRTPFARVATADLLLRALAGQAGVPIETAATAGAALGTGALVDLRDVRDPAALERDWLAPLLARREPSLELDFGCGLLVHWQPRHRWRVWRRRIGT